MLLVAGAVGLVTWAPTPEAEPPAPAPDVAQAVTEVVPEVAPEPAVEKAAPPTVQRRLTLAAGQTLTAALLKAGLERDRTQRVAAALAELVDLRELPAGQALQLKLSEAEGGPRLQRLAFRPHVDREVVVEREADDYRAYAQPVPHERRVVASRFQVSGSLGASAVAADVPRRVVAALVRQLEHEVDFRRDLRAGDRVALTFERFHHTDTSEQHDGRLLSATLQLQDRRIAIYRFETADGISSYFDADGVSIETRLARTPVVGGWLTSTYGLRHHPLLDRTRMHRGLDFAAPEGAAVVAVDGGRVERASRYGGFGNYVRIGHGEGLATAYAHLARYAEGIKPGARVKPGQIIGYVGESGLATSPSLHYEVLRNGEQVDPHSLELPPRLRLAGEELAAFRALQDRLAAALQEAGAAALEGL